MAEENRRLNEKLNKVTLTPPIPGVYGGGGTRGVAAVGDPISGAKLDDPMVSGVNSDLPEGATGINVGPFGAPDAVITPGKTELEQQYVGPNGAVMNIYEGPDADELVTGYAIKKWFDWSDPMMDRAQQGLDFGYTATVEAGKEALTTAKDTAQADRKQAIIEEYIFQVDPSYVLRESAKHKDWAKRWPGVLPSFE